jgi:hypothetical protein
VARLYPPAWRARYGPEFEALLEDAKLTWSDLLDVFAGALRERIVAHKAGRALEGANLTMNDAATSVRILDLQDRDIPHGYEFEATIEQTRLDGGKSIVRQFCRELDFGGAYLTVSHMSRDSDPARTWIVSGTKGEVAGDFRTDRTEMLALCADGTVHRSEQTVKTWLKYEGIRERLREAYRGGKEAGLSADQVCQRLRSRHNPEPEERA